MLALESQLHKLFYLLAYRSKEGTIFFWLPLNRLKTSGVGVHALVGPVGEAVVFKERRLLGETIYRVSAIPAER